MSRTFKSTTGLSRRFLNLIAANHSPGVKSLHRIGLGRIFNSTPGPIPNGDRLESAAGQEDYMVRPRALDIIRLPTPVMSFRSSASFESKEWKLDCFPLSDCKVFCMDQSGRGFLFDANSCGVSTVAHLHTPKVKPISLSIPQPNVDEDDHNDEWGSKLFILESMPEEPEVNCQFEAFIYRMRDVYPRVLKHWNRHLVPPPPPFIRETVNQNSRRLEVTSYAVIEDGSHICISIEGAGTYCMHTVSHTWNRVGEWTLPFRGKIEYVPELKLWFGTSAESGHLAAADLSAMDSQPQLVGTWKELDPPEGWKECKDSQVVNLGSGRFCIARFFKKNPVDVRSGDELPGQSFAVLTGVEVVNRGCDAEVELRMVTHKSRRVNSTTIETLF
jgi:hypothetical protein|uniref:Uncharacterized protein n=1 Tax=Zea mays TaxID=4577 RepID=B6T6U9_MAIZE|nr:hypothetical protein [Zea mays]